VKGPFVFPSGIFPYPLSVGGLTYCCLREQPGLVMRRWQDGFPEHAITLWTNKDVTEKGEPRLTLIDGNVLVAYQIGTVVVVDYARTGDPASDWEIPCNGNSPCAWSSDGLFGVQDITQTVLQAQWPNEPTVHARAGNAEGISRYIAPPGAWVLNNEEAHRGYHLAQDGSAAVWPADLGGVEMEIGGKRGVLLPGQITNDPRVTRQGDGRYTVVYWGKDGQSTGAIVDITADDLKQIPLPEPDVEPYLRRVPHLSDYNFDADRGYGDHPGTILHAAVCTTPSDVAKANDAGAWVAAGVGHLALATRKALCIVANDYAGAPPLTTQIADAVPSCQEWGVGLLAIDDAQWANGFPANLPREALCGVYAYRNPNEPIGAFTERFLQGCARVVSSGRRVCLVVGCDDRLGTLSDVEIIEALKQDFATTRVVADIAMVRVFSYGRANQAKTTGGGIVHPKAWEWCVASYTASQKPNWTDYQLADDPPEPTPERPMNVYLHDDAEKPVNDTFKPKLLGERIPNTNGAPLRDGNLRDNSSGWCIKKPNGKLLTLTPDRRWEERDFSVENMRSWETFYDGSPGFTVAPDRDGQTFTLKTVTGR